MAYKRLVQTVNLTVANGVATGSTRFQPQAGTIIACAIFYPSTIPNTGVVSAKISNDQGEEYAPMQDIRNFRDREAGYLEGKMPLFVEATGQTFVLDIAATANFTAAFTVNLVLIYLNDYAQKQNC